MQLHSQWVHGGYRGCTEGPGGVHKQLFKNGAPEGYRGYRAVQGGTVGGPGYRPVPLFLGSMPDTLPPGRPTPTRVEPSHGEVCRRRRNEAGGMEPIDVAGRLHARGAIRRNQAQSGEPLQINALQLQQLQLPRPRGCRVRWRPCPARRSRSRTRRPCCPCRLRRCCRLPQRGRPCRSRRRVRAPH